MVLSIPRWHTYGKVVGTHSPEYPNIYKKRNALATTFKKLGDHGSGNVDLQRGD
jgi:hypothetical protein